MSGIPSMKVDSKNEEARTGKSLLAEQYKDGPKYPPGLVIYLSDEEMDKLGIQALPRIGDRFLMKAFVEVKSLNENESEGHGKDRNITMQITNMLLKMVDEERDAEQVMYGEPVKPKMMG